MNRRKLFATVAAWFAAAATLPRENPVAPWRSHNVPPLVTHWRAEFSKGYTIRSVVFYGKLVRFEDAAKKHSAYAHLPEFVLHSGDLPEGAVVEPLYGEMGKMAELWNSIGL